MYNVRYISILTHRFFNFRSVDFGLQYVNYLYSHFIDYKQHGTVEKCYFSAFLRWQHFPGRGLGYGGAWQKWMKLAFSTTNHIPCNALYISTNHTPCNHVINPHIRQLSMTQSHGFIYNQIPIIIIYNLLTNR